MTSIIPAIARESGRQQAQGAWRRELILAWRGGKVLQRGDLRFRHVDVQGKVLQEEGTVRAKAGRQA